jgi:AmmeMemoRadiSam system protein B
MKHPTAHSHFISVGFFFISKRVFVLGPSHHVYTTKCKLSKQDYYATPLGNLKVDRELTDRLFSTNQFEWMSKEEDEDEHSLEMQMPYIAKVLQKRYAPFFFCFF